MTGERKQSLLQVIEATAQNQSVPVGPTSYLMQYDYIVQYSGVPLPLQQVLVSHLSPLIPQYLWFNQENFMEALGCLQAAVAAHNAGNWTMVGIFIETILDWYHKDRADRACASLGNTLTVVSCSPIRRTEIPQDITGKDGVYRLKFTLIDSWSETFPITVARPMSLVARTALPDNFYLASYEQTSPRKADPVIYAHYSTWYVKLAEWK